MRKYKVDVNSYDSDTFPAALYKWETGFLWGKWKHVQSFRNKDEAIAFYKKIEVGCEGLPIFLL